MGEPDPVELLRRQYFQCLDPDSLTLPKREFLRLPETQRRIYGGMFGESRVVYAPPVRYRFRVLKRIVGALEEAIEDPDEDEVSNDISEYMALCMAHPIPPASEAAQQKSYVTYTAPSPDFESPSVTLLESRSLLASSGTTGFRTWEAALYLASYLFSSEARHLVSNKNIIELGAGTGFLSIFCAAHLGARYVLATDGSNELINNLQENVHLNDLSLGGKIHSTVLNWGQTLIGGPADCREVGKAFDLVIGADVTYDVQSIPALVATMRDLFELYPKAQVLISATVRNEDTLATFSKACGANSFSATLLESSAQSEIKQVGFFYDASTPINVYVITIPGKVVDPFSI